MAQYQKKANGYLNTCYKYKLEIKRFESSALTKLFNCHRHEMMN